MVDLIRRYASMGLAVCAIAVLPQVVQAQIMPDGTLPTLVGSPNGLDFAIEGGSRSGNNLFHSFSQFSVPANGAAVFNNATDVQNIFSRVTGSQISTIDGILKAQGNANLFLMNPNGIIFGSNAQLQLGGSFLATTATGIKFEDRIEFSAMNTTPALLSVNVPIGLQMGQNPGAISVQGQGHSIFSPNIFSPAPLVSSTTGLSVQPGNTLALIGNSIDLKGGLLSAPSGQVELGSITAGQVTLQQLPQGWQFDYANPTALGNISLSQAALVQATGNPGGSIRLRGQNIQMEESSLILIQNLGTKDAGGISIHASEMLSLRGGLRNRDITAINSETLNKGAGANIAITARQVQMLDGARAISSTFRQGAKGGNISIQAMDSITAIGDSPFDPSRVSGVGTVANVGGGQGGDLFLTTRQLMLRDGGAISAAVFGGLKGGNLQATVDRVDLIGASSIGTGSALNSTTLFGGNGGQVQVNARQVSLQNGAVIGTTTTGQGNAGSLILNATESITISEIGKSKVSRVSASGESVSPVLQKLLRIPAFPSGNAGDIEINTPRLEINNGAGIFAGHTGTGSTGTLKINTDQIQLNQGTISVSSNSGKGGNINLMIGRNLILRQTSLINATSDGVGNGGNITINSPIIIGFKNSDIIANAIRGGGGNIQITTQGIFGLKYRDRLTPANDITASSEFGVNGTVQVNAIGVDPNSGLTSLPVDIVDPSQKIATGCTNQSTSSFVATGRGGIPENPMQSLNGDRIWRDLRDVAVAGTTKPGKLAIAPAQFAEATAWQINSQGQPELIDQGLGSMPKSDRISCAK
jgi:filamentous hemagglutinin family protein